MKFTPKTESEIEKLEKERKERWVWPVANSYDFEIIGCLEKEGDYGAYLHLDVKVFHPNGEWHQVLTDFVGSDSPKLRALCESTGLLSAYEDGDVNDYDFNNKSGKLKLGVKKDKSGQYPDKNRIAEYLKAPVAAKPQTQKQVEDEFGDSVPF